MNGSGHPLFPVGKLQIRPALGKQLCRLWLPHWCPKFSDSLQNRWCLPLSVFESMWILKRYFAFHYGNLVDNIKMPLLKMLECSASSIRMSFLFIRLLYEFFTSRQSTIWHAYLVQPIKMEFLKQVPNVSFNTQPRNHVDL